MHASQALALLANLLMKDYVKWRGALFHRFALALVDTSPAVRNLAEYLLGDTLAVKVGCVKNEGGPIPYKCAIHISAFGQVKYNVYCA